uniref:F-box domain-containing protein n=1 Tax=Ditylenchus dipsaci TaxID=166011 RepID=A0A915EUM3_9BILA
MQRAFLSDDTWSNIFAFLSASDLDQIQLVNHQLVSIRRRYFADKPLRLLYALYVLSRSYLVVKECPVLHEAQEDHFHFPLVEPGANPDSYRRVQSTTDSLLMDCLEKKNVRFKALRWEYRPQRKHQQRVIRVLERIGIPSRVVYSV